MKICPEKKFILCSQLEADLLQAPVEWILKPTDHPIHGLMINIWIYFMTCMALFAISLENHKKKGPVWGPYMSKW